MYLRAHRNLDWDEVSEDKERLLEPPCFSEERPGILSIVKPNTESTGPDVIVNMPRRPCGGPCTLTLLCPKVSNSKTGKVAPWSSFERALGFGKGLLSRHPNS